MKKITIPAAIAVIAASIYSFSHFVPMGNNIQSSDVQNNTIQDSEVQNKAFEKSDIKNSQVQKSEDRNSNIQNSEIQTSGVYQIPSSVTETKKTGIAPYSTIMADVVKVTDGDTLEIKYKGKEYKVRLLCVDTPESVKTNVAVQPFGKEASQYTKQKVYGREIRLVFDKGLRDRYGRLLAYVLLGDDYFLNADLVQEGYARVEIVSPNSSLSGYFKDLQEKAITHKKGLWGLPEEKQPFVKEKNGSYVPRYWDKQEAS